MPAVICDASIAMSAPVAAVTRPYASTVSDVIVLEADKEPVSVYDELANVVTVLLPVPITN